MTLHSQYQGSALRVEQAIGDAWDEATRSHRERQGFAVMLGGEFGTHFMTSPISRHEVKYSMRMHIKTCTSDES